MGLCRHSFSVMVCWGQCAHATLAATLLLRSPLPPSRTSTLIAVRFSHRSCVPVRSAFAVNPSCLGGRDPYPCCFLPSRGPAPREQGMRNGHPRGAAQVRAADGRRLSRRALASRDTSNRDPWFGGIISAATPWRWLSTRSGSSRRGKS